MAGINLAKNWCAKLIFFKLAVTFQNQEKFSLLILNWLCFAKQSHQKIQVGLSSQMCGSTVI